MIGIVGAGYGLQVIYPAFKNLTNQNVILFRRAESEDTRKGLKIDSISNLPNYAPFTIISIAVPPVDLQKVVAFVAPYSEKLIIEKPGGFISRGEAERLPVRVDNSLCFYAYQYRYDPIFRKFRSMLVPEDIKRINIRWLTSNRLRNDRFTYHHTASRGGGIIFTHLPHIFDYLHWLTDGFIELNSVRKEILVKNRVDVNGKKCETDAPDYINISGKVGSIDVEIEVSNCTEENIGHSVSVNNNLTLHYPPGAQFGKGYISRGGESVINLPGSCTNLDSRVIPYQNLVTDLMNRKLLSAFALHNRAVAQETLNKIVEVHLSA